MSWFVVAFGCIINWLHNGAPPSGCSKVKGWLGVRSWSRYVFARLPAPATLETEMGDGVWIQNLVC